MIVVLTDKRLKEKEGTHRTFVSFNLEEKVMVPMCVILFVSPRGSSTTVYVIAVIFVNKFTEQIIWLVALVSKTHHYKKFILLRWVKTTAKAQKSTAKGTFDL